MHTNITANSDSEQLQTLSRDELWNRHINQWRESGLSKKAYCEQFSLAYQQMVYWCAKSTNMKNKEKKPSSDFVAITMKPATQSVSGLRIQLPNGTIVEGIDGHSVSLVGKLIEQL